ncbi:MAG: hypothetical protein AAF432_03525 [Planctomycetota bacterium]
MTLHARNTVRTLSLVVCASIVTGCVTESVTSDGRPMPAKPRRIEAPPSTAVVAKLAFLIGAKPKDSNGNGFPDLFETTVMLFTADEKPLHRDGAFHFTLTQAGMMDDPETTPLHEWTMSSEEAEAYRRTTLMGPVYEIPLSLASAPIERVPMMAADMIVEFRPSDGGPSVRCNGVRTIQFGRRSVR